MSKGNKRASGAGSQASPDVAAGFYRPGSLAVFGAALRRRRESLGMTLDTLMDKTGISKPYLSNIETGRAPGVASEEKLRRVAGALRLPVRTIVAAADWLRAPESVRRLLADAAPARRADGAIDLDAAVKEGGENAECGMRNAEMKMAGGGIPLRAVPLINRVAAGRASEYTDLDYPRGVADVYVPVPDLPESPVGSAFGVRVIGDSMMPEYAEGEILIVGPAGEDGVREGDDCVVRLGETENFATTFKRIFFVRDGDGHATAVRLVAINPAYAERVVRMQDVSGIYPVLWRMVRGRRGG